MQNTDKPPAQTPRASSRPRRRPAHTLLDARTWQFKLLETMRADLRRHVGGSPSVPQTVLIERAAWLTVRLAEMDARTRAGEVMSDRAGERYLAWSNALARILDRIGPQSAATAPAALRDHIARRGTGVAA